MLLADRDAFRNSAHLWVRATAAKALDEVLKAGNPTHYVVGVDGTTGSNGKVRQGFKPGTISSANTSVRVEFVGEDLAKIANALRPILIAVIKETFPNSRTKALEASYSWWVQRGANAEGGENVRSVRLGPTVPDSVTIYDVLWLVPDVGPARYAWFANHNAIQSSGHAYNLIVKKRDSKSGRKGDVRLRKRLRGFIAEATLRMRGHRRPGVTIQGRIIKNALTGSAARSRYGVPVIRLGYHRGLERVLEILGRA